MSKGGKYLKPKASGGKGKGKKPLLIVLCTLLVLILAVVIALVAYVNGLFGKINKVDVPKIDYAALATETMDVTEAPMETTEAATEATTEATTVAATEPHVASSEDYINFLVVGQAARFGEEDHYADSMILCTVNTYEKTLTMTSMLRDTLIRGTQYKGHTYGGIKLTTVYNMGYQWGGTASAMELMNMTLFLNFGVEVDHNIEINFGSVVKIVNMMGGVDMELTQEEADYLNADDGNVIQELVPGWNTLDGGSALSYARMRKVAGKESDIDRTDRQRKMIEAIIAKLKTLSLSELKDLVETALPFVTTSMTNAEITEMVGKLLPMLSDLKIIRGGTCPANYKGDVIDIYNDGYPDSILRFNEQETKAYMRAITEGEGVIPEATE